MKIKVILFDLDGTLRDTREVIYPAIEYTLIKHVGKSPSRNDMKKQIHHHSEIHKEFAPSIPHELFEISYKEHAEKLRSNTKLYEGVIDLLESLKEKGYKLGIVSSAYTASGYLQSINAFQYFDTIIGGLETKEHKPHPEPINLALKKLEVEPSEAIFVGDLPADIEASISAGLHATIGITHGFGMREDLIDAGCDIIVDSLLEIEQAIMSIENDA
jgi:pyrophosphatase PpaX